MLDAVSLKPGDEVLELAAGLGETGMLAAAIVGPTGGVIVSDQADAMLDGARARAAELGLSNVEFRVLGAEWIDLPLASVDAVLCRWGYMLLADPAAALGETRRVLRPAGTAGAGGVGFGPAQSLGPAPVARADRARPDRPARASERRAPSRSAIPSACGSCSPQAGFAEIEVQAIDIEQRHPSFEVFWETTLDISRGFHDAVLSRPEPEIAEIRAGLASRLAPYTSAEGALAIPARTLVASATA